MMRLVSREWSDDMPWAWPAGDVFHSFLSFIGAMAILMAVTGFLAGFGLLERRPWARSLAIVLGVIALLHPPLGTALGIYTLWVLLPNESEQEYRRTARPA
jgi:ABC-type spermidine/putrescine transport system permease subunit II